MSDIKMKFFDAHIHVYPDAIAERAVNSLGAFYEFIPEGTGTRADFFESSKRGGCCGFIALGVATNAAQTASVNNFLAQTVEIARKDGFDAYGFMGMHQEVEDIESEAKRAVKLGLCGAKIHPDIQGIDPLDRRLFPLYEFLQKNNLPLCFHVGDVRPRINYAEPEKIAEVARRYPSLRICAAHFGGYGIFERSEILVGLPNVRVDCSSALWLLDPENIVSLIRRFGSDRVMFGTDYPVKRCDGEIARFERLVLTDDEKERVLLRTAKDFLSGK